ncbi:MAG: response regulator transcription factor [Marmoricola sp.]
MILLVRRPTIAGVHIVVVEDQQRMRELVCSYLTESGLSATGCADAESALIAIGDRDADAVVLDLMLPGMSGLTLCRTLRKLGNDIPILMLTARGSVTERVQGLEAGADDYLIKPFALEELLARVRAITRRREPTSAALVAGDVVLDPQSRRVTVAGMPAKLSRREFAVLQTLMSPPGRVVSRLRLLDEVWDEETDLRSNAIEVHLSRVRHQLESSTNVQITTLRGVGYRLDVRR